MSDLRKVLTQALAKATAPLRAIDRDRVRQAEEAYGQGETTPFQKGMIAHPSG
jgi:hypothetical protein